MKRLATGAIAVVGLLFLSGGDCGGGSNPPTLSKVQPDRGYPRQLLSVDGSQFDAVEWDPGQAGAVTLGAGLPGSVYFQVPDSATAGAHTVALKSGGATSDTETVTVLAASGSYPAPRIEDVGVYEVTDNGGTIDLKLTVAAANLDTDATVTVDGTARTSVVWGGLPLAYQQDHTPATFGYPVYHYLQHLVEVPGVSWGDTLSIVVTNHDSQASAAYTYALPATAAELDSDGDGLLDSYDGGTYTAPSGATIDLAAMGTDKLRKDILIEVDWTASAQPRSGIWSGIEDVFAKAPVLNPDGSAGITMLIDRGQGGRFTGGGQTLTPDHDSMDFGTCPGCTNYVSFETYKASNFDADRLRVFRYAIFGRARPNGSSGRGELPGNDFMVTFANFSNWNHDLSQIGTFVHELGHNLDLWHGGINGGSGSFDAWKPNLMSTMGYRYQFRGIPTDCTQNPGGLVTYSQGVLRALDETSANEGAGLCDNVAVDFDGDGSTDPAGSSVNMNESQTCPCSDPTCTTDCDANDTHEDADQWGNLELNFQAPGSRWGTD